ncbi:hypothetical protein WA577_004316 [Blastocystis sp. JDR]
MGCIPSKTENPEQNGIQSPLIVQESPEDGKPHSVENYVASSSEEEERALLSDRRNGSQHMNMLVKQSVEDLIDVPALAYTLYGTNSPYNYCEEYNSVISSVKMVDGILKVDASNNVDLSEPVEDLLRKPVVIDFAKMNRCGEELDDIIDSLKVKGDSLVVEF